MESSSKHKSTKNLLNKIFHPNSGKKSSVSPSSSPPEQTPSLFSTMDDSSRWPASSQVNHITDYSNLIHNYRMDVAPSDSREGRLSAPSAAPVQRSNSVQRRCSLSNMQDNRQRLIAAKRAEYQAKMDAFDDLIRKRRGSTLRIALASDA